MSGAPDWQDGECCFRCRTQFTLVARKHHCRNCGNIFCAKCSSQSIPLPRLNIEKSVRVCDGCYEKLSKNEDNLVLARIKSPENEQQTMSKSISKSTATSSTAPKSSASNKSPSNASAPSEQELKEEEELQLALALSLSEAPAKVSFPDCRQLEEASSSTSDSTSNAKEQTESPAQTNNNIVVQPPLNSSQTKFATEQQQYANHITNKREQQVLGPIPMQQDTSPLGQDRELLNFVAEVQSTAEVFANRVNSNKLRNRPVADDSAIQSLFLRLSNMHTKLLEHIKAHEDERSGFEAIQDKLSQIADARAALDALREEHQEKKRQEAAEADRLRQSQLAAKLEMMRQKKSQMMQYQRDLALQRLQQQQQALMVQSPQNVAAATGQPQPATVNNSFQSVALPGASEMHVAAPTVTIQEQHQQEPRQQLPQQQSQQTPIHSQHLQFNSQPPISQPSIHNVVPVPGGSALGSVFNNMQTNNHVKQGIQQQYEIPTVPKVEDEAPLISFDD